MIWLYSRTFSRLATFQQSCSSSRRQESTRLCSAQSSCQVGHLSPPLSSPSLCWHMTCYHQHCRWSGCSTNTTSTCNRERNFSSILLSSITLFIAYYLNGTVSFHHPIRHTKKNRPTDVDIFFPSQETVRLMRRFKNVLGVEVNGRVLLEGSANSTDKRSLNFCSANPAHNLIRNRYSAPSRTSASLMTYGQINALIKCRNRTELQKNDHLFSPCKRV